MAIPPDSTPWHIPQTNSLPEKFPPRTNPGCNERRCICNVTLFFAVVLAEKPILAKDENFLALRHGQICRVRSSKHWQQQWLSSLWRLQATVCRSCYDNCNSAPSGQLYLLLPLLSCWRVWPHVLRGSHSSVEISLAYIHVPWDVAPKRPAVGKIAQKVAWIMESNANDRQKCSFLSKHGRSTLYYTFTHL